MPGQIPFSSTSDVKNRVDDVATNPTLQRVARVGYAAKGFVFVVVGVLALRAAFGLGGEATGERGAMISLVGEPFGGVLIGALGAGLAAFSAWRFIEMLALTIRPQHRATDVLTHFGALISGLAYASLALAAWDLFQGRGTPEGGPQGLVGRMLAQPFGQGLVLVAALGAIAFGVYQVYYGVKELFLRKLDMNGASPRAREWARRLGKCGLSARGVVLVIVGGFLFRAGLTSEASRAKGLAGVFGYLESFPGGAVLVALMGLGLLCSGLFCFFDARSRTLLKA